MARIEESVVNNTPQITHYWSVVNLCNPPGVTWKLSDGSVVYGVANEGSLPSETTPAREPHPIVGYDPKTREYGYKFGDWRPVSEWLKGGER